ncbi:MAG: phosphatase PAP2 family protein [Cyanobacteria bacterium SIG31]|nr:phosphatase PAP2 family protein [Cyanobacteria bacterium SIG31]
MLLFLIVLFILFSVVINTYPAITLWDRELIIYIQSLLKDVPLWVPTAFDGMLYATMIVIPLIFAWICFARKKKYFDIAFLGAIPLITYGFSSILKHIVERPRPPMELHLSVHPGGFSYVSSHTLISFCLWGMIIYYLIKYCENKALKIVGITIASTWMALIGFSRAWLGVHNPTDVLAAYFLGIILLIIYINARKFFEKYIGL